MKKFRILFSNENIVLIHKHRSNIYKIVFLKIVYLKIVKKRCKILIGPRPFVNISFYPKNLNDLCVYVFVCVCVPINGAIKKSKKGNQHRTVRISRFQRALRHNGLNAGVILLTRRPPTNYSNPSNPVIKSGQKEE